MIAGCLGFLFSVFFDVFLVIDFLIFWETHGGFQIFWGIFGMVFMIFFYGFR